jgi:isopenicillin N synthase-like dioxygenase
MSLEPIFPPLIDLSSFSNNATDNATLKQEVALSLRNACREVGFFQVRSNALSSALISDAFDATKEFFDLPLLVKESASAFDSPLFRGYQGVTSDSHSCTPEDGSTATETKLIDTNTPVFKRKKENKESFTIGAQGVGKMLGPNNWPESVGVGTSIRQRLDRYWDAMLQVSLEISRALALSLELNESFFTENMQKAVAQMVLLRYPPPTELTQACGAHTDCGFLTLLAQDQKHGGLQIQDNNGSWIPASQLDGCILVNLGDMAAAWSNNYYKSTFHRVSSNLKRQRHSIPFFCNLNYDAVVDPRDVCDGTLDVGEPHMTPVLAGDYLCEKLGLMHDGKK